MLKTMIYHLFKYLCKHRYGIVTIAILAIIINRNLLFSSTIPAGNNMLGYISQTSYFSQNLAGFYYIWSPQWFGLVQPWMLHSLLIILNFIFDNPIKTVNFFIFALFLFSGLSMYFFTYYYTKSKLAGVFSSILFISNQYYIAQWTCGHLIFLFVYSMGPILLFTLDRAIESGKLTDIIYFSITIVMLSIFSRLDSLVYWGALLFIYCIFVIIFSYHEMKNILPKFFKILTISSILFFFFGAFQFLPNLLGAQPEYYQFIVHFPLEEIKFWSLEFYYSLRGLPREVGYLYWMFGIKWDIHKFLSSSQYFLVTSIPLVLAFSALLFDRSKKTLFFLTSILIFIFLAKGPYPPLDKIFSWLYFNVPFFGFLHVPNRWLMLTWFSMSFMAGVTIKKLYDKLNFFLSRKFDNTRGKNNFISGLTFSPLFIILIIILLLPAWPVFVGGLQPFNIPNDDIKPYLYIKEQKGDFRVIGIPYAQSYMFTGEMWVHDLNSVSTLFHNKPVVGAWAFATPGYPEYFISYTTDLVLRNRTEKLMKIFGTFDIRYLVIQGYFPTEKIPTGYTPDYQHTFFKSQKGLKPVYTSGNATVYENEYWTPHIFVPSKAAIVVGGREALTALAEIDEFKFSDWAIFFADQVIRETEKETSVDLLNKSNALIFVNSEPLDVAMLMLDNVTRIKAAEYSYPSINAKDYWVGSDFATKMGLFVLNSKTLSTSGGNNVSIPVRLEKDGSYEVWARMAYYKDRGKLGLSIDGGEIGNIFPYSPNLGIKWVKLGDVELSNGRHILLLQNKKSPYGTANAIDEIILVEPEELKAKLKETKELIEKNKKVVVIVEKDKLYNLIYKELEGEEVVIDDDQTKFWQNVNPAQVVLTDNSEIKTSSENSLRLNIHEPVREFYTLIDKRYDSLQDWSNKDYFVLWFKGQGTNTLFEFAVFFNGSYNDTVKFIIPDISSEWKRFVFLKSDPDARKGNIDWSKVWLIRWGNNDKNITGDFYLDRISSGRFEVDGKDLVEKLDFPKREYQTSEFKDYFVFYSQKESEEGIKFPEIFDVKRPSPEVNFTKINPTKYVVKVKAEEPFFLIFSDSYHPMWKAYVKGEEIDSVITYSFINGFYINKTGEMDIKVEFIGQRYVWIGGIISVTSFSFAIVYILFERRIKHKLGKKKSD